jgi:apolipoprotein N-acyltransferase
MREASRLTTGYKPAALAAALGLLHAATFAPWGTWWTQLPVLVAFAALGLSMMKDGRKPAAVALAGLAFGFGWFLAGVGWLFVSMHTYGQMPAPLALLALVLFALYLALFPAAALWATASLHGRRPFHRLASVSYASTLAAALTLAELARGHLFTGFPWLAIGYAQVDGPLAGFAPLLGSYGVGFATILVAGLLAGLLTGLRADRPSRIPVDRTAQRRAAPPVRTGTPTASVWPALLVAAALLLGGAAARQVVWSAPAGAPLKIRLLQGNVPQQLKFDPRVARQTLQRYLELIEAEPADLIVLPETAWTVPWASTPPEIAERLERFVHSSGSAVAIGMPLHTAATPRLRRSAEGSAAASPAGEQTGAAAMPTNSVLLFDPAVFKAGTPPARYDKHHLVPFGEFVPWGFRWFVDLMTIPLGDFGRGPLDQPPFAVGQQRIAFNICYEDVFGEELLPALAGDDGATILANVSNIAWFGDSHAWPQHLQIARMRTIETARPMIRATNTGVTAAIDFDGGMIGELPAYQLGALTVTVQGRSGLTPYARSGNWPIAALAVLILLAAALLASKRTVVAGKPAKISR